MSNIYRTGNSALGALISSLSGNRQKSDIADQLANRQKYSGSPHQSLEALESQLKSDSSIFSSAIRNADDAGNLLTEAENALYAMQEVSDRLLELSARASENIYSGSMRTAMHTEAQALREESNRILGSAAYNGIAAFSGTPTSVDVQLDNSSVEVNLGTELSGSSSIGTGELTALGISYGIIGADNFAAADFNSDGKQDLLIGTSGGRIYHLQGNGDGTFMSATMIANTGSAIRGVISDDINGDGFADATYLQADGDIARMLGDGTGNFAGEVNVASGITGPAGLRSFDYNGDGDKDLVVAVVNGSFGFRTVSGNGNGTFAAPMNQVTSTSSGFYLTVGDVNNDGLDDLATKAGVYISNGNGSFAFSAAVTTDDARGLGDFNGDGISDVIGISSDSLSLSVRLSNGDGTFGSSITTAAGQNISGYQIKEVGDFNGDGNIDVMAGHSLSDRFLALGDGSGGFTSVNFLSGTSSDLAAADYDGDGVIDFAMGDGVFLQSGGSDSVELGQISLMSSALAIDAFNTVANYAEGLERELGIVKSSRVRMAGNSDYLSVYKENIDAARERVTSYQSAENLGESLYREILQDSSVALLAQANQNPERAEVLLSNPSLVSSLSDLEDILALEDELKDS